VLRRDQNRGGRASDVVELSLRAEKAMNRTAAFTANNGVHATTGRCRQKPQVVQASLCRSTRWSPATSPSWSLVISFEVKCQGASPAGFEPTAPGLGILCSIRLSYGDLPFCLNDL
jgi:hypothetical protein